jgi:hypothetical protein
MALVNINVYYYICRIRLYLILLLVIIDSRIDRIKIEYKKNKKNKINNEIRYRTVI